MSDKNQPIGVFDSGVGGLTVANAIKQLLPNESIVYFGDTAHLPYGDKSKQTITHYSKHVTEFLLEQNCKVIVIACNSASSNAYDEVVELVADRAKVINVIDPVVEYINSSYQVKSLGVIGTKSTIISGAYETKIYGVRSDINVKSLATPMFVPMIEEGFVFDDISNAIIRAYLSNEIFKEIDAIILGCTHYPIIKNQILKYFNFSVDVIDSARIVAQNLVDYLDKEGLRNSSAMGQDRFIVSDFTESFGKISKMFFEKEIKLETINIWA